MKLIENWRKAPRMISVQLMAITGAIQAAWPTIPQDLKDVLPHGLVNWVSIALLASAIGGRLIDQGEITKEPPP